MKKRTIAFVSLGGLFAWMKIVAEKRTEPITIDDDNPYLHPERADVLPEEARPFALRLPRKPERKKGLYERFGKVLLDNVLSFCGLLVLSPVFLLISALIKIDDPGPVFFTQKRIGKDKKYFALHKFRSMKMATPHDVPTHLLENPEQYITRVGKILRKTSLDELPQIWDIFRGKMSVIGPRPALWNQADLVAEREMYAANDLTPGLTGWAQINGRDELEIDVKARLDGEYAEKISLGFDAHCFIDTVFSVLKSEGVVEGGTGELQKTGPRYPNDGKTLYPEDGFQPKKG